MRSTKQLFLTDSIILELSKIISQRTGE